MRYGDLVGSTDSNCDGYCGRKAWVVSVMYRAGGQRVRRSIG